jgi:hypothetical protein
MATYGAGQPGPQTVFASSELVDLRVREHRKLDGTSSTESAICVTTMMQ